MCYVVYILYSKSCGKFYTGHTHDFHNRLLEHNAGETKSIALCLPFEPVWKTEVSTRSKAMTLEKKIKSRGAARFLADLQIFIKK